MKGIPSTFFAAIRLLICFLHFSNAACPPGLLEGCECNDDPGQGPSVRCDNVTLANVFASLKNASLERLSLSRCSSSQLLEPIALAAVRELEMVECGITGIGDKVLTPIGDSLEILVLARNKLTSIPTLRSLPRLTSLNLDENVIKDVPEGVFLGVPLMRQLRMQRNQICTLSSTALNETKARLELLDLSGNCMTIIPAQSLRNSPRLMYLDLSSNGIAEIGNFNIMNLPELRELRLNDNLLNKIMPMAFMNVPKLQVLHMKNNLLAEIDGNHLQTFAKLEILDVRNNMLSKIPSFKELPQLKQIRLDGNLITRVDTLAFSSNPKLQLVSIQDNAISIIARNSFDSLDQLVVLLLANNSIKAIEQGMLHGVKNLQQLNLRNNSLTAVDAATFGPLKQLTTLDLGYNQLVKIAKGSFEPLTKLFWLDLSGNRLARFDKGTFMRRISNILLDGNPLYCDEQLDWFVQWLVVNRVRTFMSAQPEIVCAGPKNLTGTRLKELMVKKANETQFFNDNPTDSSALLNAFLPGLGSMPRVDAANGAGSMAGLNAVPSLRPGASASEESALFKQLIQSMPVINVPGYGNFDLKQLPPSLIEHVLRGGQIPGVPKEVLDRIVQICTAKIASMSSPLEEGERKAIVEKLPVVVTKDYRATNQLPINSIALEILKMLPAGYNISRIPVQVIDALARGEVPDFSLLPSDLQEHLKAQSDKMIAMFMKDSQGNASIDALLAKLPRWERPVLPTFSPYDINQIGNDFATDEASNERAAFLRTVSAVALGAIGAFSLAVLAVLCLRRRRLAALESSVLMGNTKGSSGNGITKTPAIHQA